MHKAILKLTATGVMITALLAVAMITQGCDNKNDPTPQTTQTGQMTETTQTTQTTQPSQNIIIDETGIHIQIPTEETTAATQPTEPAPTEKPGLGQTIKDFFENLFGGDKDETEPAQTTQTQPEEDDGKVTYQDYLDMNDDQRADFQLSFAENRSESLDLFTEWLRVARAEHEDETVIGTIGPDGNINLEDFLKP